MAGKNDNFGLSEESMDKIGINPDYSEREDVEEGADDKESEEPEKFEPINFGEKLRKREGGKDEETTPEDKKKESKSEKTTDDDKKEKDDKIDESKDSDEEKKPDETDDETPPDDGKEVDSDEVEPEFKDEVIERVSKFDDNTREKFLDDLDKWEKFTASSTQRSQEAAETLRQATELFDLIGGEQIKEAIANEELLEALDEWFDPDADKPDKSKNPFRSINQKNIEHYSKEQRVLKESKEQLELEKEILAIQRFDSQYEDSDKLVELGDYADEHGTTLLVAAKLRAGEQKDDDIKKLQDKNKDLSKQLNETQEELKKRNADYQKLEKTSAKKTTTGVSESHGAEKVDFIFSNSDKSKSFMDDIEAGVKKKLNVE